MLAQIKLNDATKFHINVIDNERPIITLYVGKYLESAVTITEDSCENYYEVLEWFNEKLDNVRSSNNFLIDINKE